MSLLVLGKDSQPLDVETARRGGTFKLLTRRVSRLVIKIVRTLTALKIYRIVAEIIIFVMSG